MRHWNNQLKLGQSSAFVKTNGGWIELGRDDCRSSLVRVLDLGGMLWEGTEPHDSPGDAMDEAEKFIAQWRKAKTPDDNQCLGR